jgi:methionine aminopeptidase
MNGRGKSVSNQEMKSRLMREAGILNAEALKAASEACVPGATTWDVNAAADRGSGSLQSNFSF